MHCEISQVSMSTAEVLNLILNLIGGLHMMYLERRRAKAIKVWKQNLIAKTIHNIMELSACTIIMIMIFYIIPTLAIMMKAVAK